MAGNICLTWKYEKDSPATHDEVRRLFDDQIRLQIEGGPLDFFIGETFLHVGEALLALECIQMCGLPSMITLSFEGPKTCDGKMPGEAAKMLEDAGSDIVGTNCWQDPQRMLPTVEQMREAVKCYVAAQPAAYRCTEEVPFFTGYPGFPDKLDPYQLARYELGQFAGRALELGVNYIGGCCGCVGVHIRQMARAIGRLPAEERHWQQNYEQPQSATEAYKTLREQGRSKDEFLPCG